MIYLAVHIPSVGAQQILRGLISISPILFPLCLSKTKKRPAASIAADPCEIHIALSIPYQYEALSLLSEETTVGVMSL